MKYKHQNQKKKKNIKLPLNIKALLPLNTKSPKPSPPFCYKLPKAKSIIRRRRRWKNTPVLRKICSQGCNFCQQLIQKLSMSCLCSHEGLHHGTEWVRRGNSRVHIVSTTRRIHSCSKIHKSLISSRHSTRGRSCSRNFTSWPLWRPSANTYKSPCILQTLGKTIYFVGMCKPKKLWNLHFIHSWKSCELLLWNLRSFVPSNSTSIYRIKRFTIKNWWNQVAATRSTMTGDLKPLSGISKW